MLWLMGRLDGPVRWLNRTFVCSRVGHWRKFSLSYCLRCREPF